MKTVQFEIARSCCIFAEVQNDVFLLQSKQMPGISAEDKTKAYKPPKHDKATLNFYLTAQVIFIRGSTQFIEHTRCFNSPINERSKLNTNASL